MSLNHYSCQKKKKRKKQVKKSVHLFWVLGPWAPVCVGVSPAVQWADDGIFAYIWHVRSLYSDVDVDKVPWIAGRQMKGLFGLWEAGRELLVLRMCDHSALHPRAGWHGHFDDGSLCLGYQYKVSLPDKNQARREFSHREGEETSLAVRFKAE